MRNTHGQMIEACQSSDDFETKCAHLILFIFHQPVHKVRANKSSSSSYQNPHVRLPTKGEKKEESYKKYLLLINTTKQLPSNITKYNLN